MRNTHIYYFTESSTSETSSTLSEDDRREMHHTSVYRVPSLPKSARAKMPAPPSSGTASAPPIKIAAPPAAPPPPPPMPFQKESPIEQLVAHKSEYISISTY